jgi:hypothetical protein
MVKELTRISKILFCFNRRLIEVIGAILFVFALFAARAEAIEIKTGNSDVNMRFDNTLTYSLMTRLSEQDAALLADPNKDDGDRNFDKGLVMNRLDLLSELDFSYKEFGVRVSGAAWYDTVYNKKNDNDSPVTANQTSVPYNEFTDATVKLHGKNAELLDAFTFGTFYLGDMGLSYKVGQYALWWGTSFFFGDNGIAAGMAPVDAAKAASLPNTQMKEMIRPIPQVSASLQVSNRVSLSGYYQFKWEGVRIPAVGSYFSNVDILIDGGERLLVAPGIPGMEFTRGKDLEPDDSGQYGFQAKYASPFQVDFGAYYLNYHDKGPQVYTTIAGFMNIPKIGTIPIFDKYYLVYPENIKAYGLSANTSFGIWTIGAEVTLRDNAPLKSPEGALSLLTFTGQTADNDKNPLYPVGRTLHANVNLFMPGLPPTFLSDTATLIFEVGYNERISVEKNEKMLDPAKEKYGLKMKMVYEPEWSQALPGFDVSLPMGIEYAPEGRSSVQDTGVHKGGAWNIGISGTYNNVWDLSLSYVNYFGNEEYPIIENGQPSGYGKYQTLGDRDYLSFYIRRAF